MSKRKISEEPVQREVKKRARSISIVQAGDKSGKREKVVNIAGKKSGKDAASSGITQRTISGKSKNRKIIKPKIEPDEEIEEALVEEEEQQPMSKAESKSEILRRTILKNKSQKSIINKKSIRKIETESAELDNGQEIEQEQEETVPVRVTTKKISKKSSNRVKNKGNNGALSLSERFKQLDKSESRGIKQEMETTEEAVEEEVEGGEADEDTVFVITVPPGAQEPSDQDPVSDSMPKTTLSMIASAASKVHRTDHPFQPLQAIPSKPQSVGIKGPIVIKRNQRKISSRVNIAGGGRAQLLEKQQRLVPNSFQQLLHQQQPQQPRPLHYPTGRYELLNNLRPNPFGGPLLQPPPPPNFGGRGRGHQQPPRFQFNHTLLPPPTPGPYGFPLPSPYPPRPGRPPLLQQQLLQSGNRSSIFDQIRPFPAGPFSPAGVRPPFPPYSIPPKYPLNPSTILPYQKKQTTKPGGGFSKDDLDAELESLNNARNQKKTTGGKPEQPKIAGNSIPNRTSPVTAAMKPYSKGTGFKLPSNSLDAELDDYWKGYVKKKPEGDDEGGKEKDTATTGDDDDDDDDPVLIGL